MARQACRPLLLALVVCCLIQGVAAVNTVEIEDVQHFVYNVSSPGQTIPQINLYGLREGVTVVNLDAYGDLYQLKLVCSREGLLGAWWVWDVSLTYPNGTTNTEHLKNLAPAAQVYDLHVQYFIGEEDWILDADIYVDVLPMKVQYGATPATLNRQFVAFSSVSATSPDIFSAKIFELTPDEFEKMKKGDFLFQFGETVKNIGKDFFTWAWEGILWFVEKIPVLGPYLAAILEISGAVVGEIVAWGLFLLENIEVILMFVEGIILSEALISTRRRPLTVLLRRIVDNHVGVLKFSLWLLDLGIVIFTRLIDLVARIVQAIKPL